MKRERSKNVYLKIVKRKGLLLKIFLLGLGLTTGVFLLFLFNSTSDRNFNYDNIKYDLIIDYAREDTIGVINNNLYVDDYQVLKSYYADYYTRSDEENRLIFNPVDGEEYGLFAHETPKSIVYILNEDNYEKIIMLDMRYYMGNVAMLCEKEEVTNVLVLYSLSNFVSDENMIKLGL